MYQLAGVLFVRTGDLVEIACRSPGSRRCRDWRDAIEDDFRPTPGSMDDERDEDETFVGSEVPTVPYVEMTALAN